MRTAINLQTKFSALLSLAALLGLFLLAPSLASAAVTSVTPLTWNIVGLDSNTPAFGPNRFPVGARVCSDSAGSVSASFNWDSTNSYISLSSSSPSAVTLDFTGAGCLDAYFEVEITKTSAAFDTTRRYYISAGGQTTPQPRELYVERLVSQARNAISNIEYRRYDGTGTLPWISVGAGGGFALVKDETYEIRMSSYTATQGYEQLESFSTLPNTIFQLLRVDTTYTADTTPYVSSPNDKLYGDACRWDNDLNSPDYRACLDTGKIGGTISVTYRVKILALPSGGGSIALLSLIYDFSGSSFHYNSDYNSGGRSIIVVDPATATIAKNFSPDPVNIGGISTLTFTLSNPNGAALGGANFTDTLPADMVVANPTGASTSSCGTPAFSPAAGATSLSFSNGTIPAYGNCTVKVNVTVPNAATYSNDSDNLFIGTTNTGDDAQDTLTADTTSFPPIAPPSACSGQEVTLATWTMETAQGTGTPPAYTPGSKHADVATATASFTDRPTFSNFIESVTAAYGNPLNSWAATGWYATPTGPPAFPSATTAPYYEFTLDTRKFSGITVSTDYLLLPNGDWGNPGDNNLYVYAQADTAAGFTTLLNTPSTKNTPIRGPVTSTPYAPSGATSSTVFRINGTGASKPGGTMYLDNITFRGCRRPDPPTLTKAFSPSPVKVNGTSTLTFTVTNPNTAYGLTGIEFSDTLPAGLTVATGSSSQCGGTLATTAPSTITFTGGTRTAGSAACTITATVTATTAGPHENVSGIIKSTESGPNNTTTGIATANLTAVNPPEIAKQFGPNPILADGVSTLTFTLTNPNPDNALSGVAFADTLPISPGAMVLANGSSTNSCGGTLQGTGASPDTSALEAGDTAIQFTGGTIAAGGACTVSVNVTAPALGDYANTSGNVSHVINSETVTGNSASDTLTITAPSPAIALLKQVGKTATGPWSPYVAVAAGANVYYRLIVENAGDVPLTSVGVSDPLVSTAACSWLDGDGTSLTAPFALPVADADDGHFATCILGPVTAVAGLNPNTATASGTYGGTTYTDSSTARYATTDLTLAKTAAETTFSAANDVLHYSYVLTNTGYSSLVGPATVADDKSSDESCPAVSTAVLAADGNPGDGDNYLDPGEQITCTATYTVTAADVLAGKVTNIATATIGGATSPQATRTIPLDVIVLLFSKTVTPAYDPINGSAPNARAIPGAWMDYTLQVSNSGGGSLDDDTLVITDPIPANTDLFVGVLDSDQGGPVIFSDPDTDSGFTLTASGSPPPTYLVPFTLGFFTDAACTTATGGLAPDADGFDAAIRCLSISMDGIMGGTADTANPTDFSLTFRVRIN